MFLSIWNRVICWIMFVYFGDGPSAIILFGSFLVISDTRITVIHVVFEWL